MRVTHVITRLIVGGAQENTIASVLGLRQIPGFEVDLVSGPTTGPEGSLESALAGDRRLLTVEPHLVRPLHPWHDLRARQNLTALFRARKPDVVHTHSGKAGYLGRLAAACAGVPIIIHTIHGPSFGPFQGPVANALFTFAERRAARVTTHFVVVADAMRRQYLAAGVGRPEQFTRVFSGFPLEPFLSTKNDASLRARLGLAPEDIVVGKIARLFKLKGHDDLLTVAPEVVRRNPKIKFLLVGDGAWRGRLEARARELGVARNFVFAGLVAPSEVPAYVGVMDMLVHLSLREGLPRALPQALAVGRPVIAYDCDGANEVCRDNVSGLLLKPGDLAGLTAGLLKLAGDAGLRMRLGNAGREFVRANFSVEQMVSALSDLYRGFSRGQSRE